MIIWDYSTSLTLYNKNPTTKQQTKNKGTNIPVLQPLPPNRQNFHAMRDFPKILVIELISEQYSSTGEQELAAQTANLGYKGAPEWHAGLGGIWKWCPDKHQ